MSWMSQPLSADLNALSARSGLVTPARVAVKVAVLLTIWCERYRTRQALKQLTSEQLKDVGLTRHEAEQEAERPFFWR